MKTLNIDLKEFVSTEVRGNYILSDTDLEELLEAIPLLLSAMGVDEDEEVHIVLNCQDVLVDSESLSKHLELKANEFGCTSSIINVQEIEPDNILNVRNSFDILETLYDNNHKDSFKLALTGIIETIEEKLKTNEFLILDFGQTNAIDTSITYIKQVFTKLKTSFALIKVISLFGGRLIIRGLTKETFESLSYIYNFYLLPTDKIYEIENKKKYKLNIDALKNWIQSAFPTNSLVILNKLRAYTNDEDEFVPQFRVCSGVNYYLDFDKDNSSPIKITRYTNDGFYFIPLKIESVVDFNWLDPNDMKITSKLIVKDECFLSYEEIGRFKYSIHSIENIKERDKLKDALNTLKTERSEDPTVNNILGNLTIPSFTHINYSVLATNVYIALNREYLDKYAKIQANQTM